jgi:alkanesulfonate monooxygenase SsuD/methylene tetrahydromethanopterin reductase-like flavin-dependent oxidoreductase (luciferase family)
MSETHSRLSDFLGTVSTSVLKEPEPEIDYQPGVEMTLALTKPLQSTVKVTPPSVTPVTPETAIYDTVNSQPFQTKTDGQGIPSDMTNLMFLGTPEQLQAAFTAAGWTSAAHLSTQSGLEVFRAVAEMRGYKEAPMSILLLDGNKPDFDFEKQNNTFAKRHHLRIWRRPGDFQGHPVWVCAATHDIGIDFSAEKRNFIHKIDSEIDRERAKVVNDLMLSGHVKALSLVARPATPQHSQNATGDKLETDGRMAVLLLD